MGGIIYSGAPRGLFLDCSRRAGHCGGKLDFPDRRARGGNPHSCASTPYKEGVDIESKAANRSACSGYCVPVLWGAIVDAGFAMLVPGVRSGEELGAKARV